jgi:hypothetical protein
MQIWVVLGSIFINLGISRIEEKSLEKCPKFLDLNASKLKVEATSSLCMRFPVVIATYCRKRNA